MKWKIFLVELTAILAAYLLLSLPIASATSVKVVTQAGWQKTDVPELVSRSVSKVGNSINVTISNLTADTVQSVYIYKCRGMEPDACASEAPDFYSVENSTLNIQIPWDEASDPTGQFANLMFIVKVLRPAGAAWQSFWHRVEQTGSSSADIDNVELYTDMYTPSDIVNFIQERAMLPFGSAYQVTKAVFLLAGSLYELRSDTAMPGFVTQFHSTNQIETPLPNRYSYVFPANGGVKNAITLYDNPSYTCGNGECETVLGESPSNCCYDCPCSAGYYCDGVGTDYESYACRSEAAMGLEVVSPSTISIGNCYISHTKEITVRISSPPASLQVISTRYSLGGGPEASAPCQDVGSGYYRCNITIPADPNCGPGERVPYLTGNRVFFDISYNDGGQTKTKELAADIPDIDLRSWVCGQYGCETDAGESSDVCCYDCACPAGQYCHGSGTVYEGYSCRPKLTDANINVVSARPASFRPHTPGDTVSLIVQISPKPAGLIVSQPSCELACLSGTEQCTATCQLACTEIPSDDPDIHNMSCALTFVIQSYDRTKSYSLTPTISLPVSYSDGPREDVRETLNRGFATITVSPSACGDGWCGTDEDFSTCCYDCACPAGQYCDWVSGTPKEGGVCREETIGIAASPEQTEFEAGIGTDGRTAQQVTNVSVHIYGAPASMQYVSAECDFNGSGCVVRGCTGAGADWMCEMAILPLDPLLSPFYNPAEKKVVLTPARFRFTITYNNGSNSVAKELVSELPDMFITPKPVCGNYICDEEFGESAETCCLSTDCPCVHDPRYGPEYVCIPGDVPESRCVKKSDIALAIVAPDTECRIVPEALGGNCTFYQGLEIDAYISNAPAYLNSYARYSLDGIVGDARCIPKEPGQTENWTCYVGLPDIPDSVSSVKKSIGLNFTITYMQAGNLVTQNISDSDDFTINMTKSPERQRCDDIQEKSNKEFEKIRKKVTYTKRLGNVLAAAGAVLMAAAIWPCGKTCFVIGCILASLGLSALAYSAAMNGVLGQLRTAKNSINDICVGTDYQSLQASIDTSMAEMSAAMAALSTASLLIPLCTLALKIKAAPAPRVTEAAGTSPQVTSAWESARVVSEEELDVLGGLLQVAMPYEF